MSNAEPTLRDVLDAVHEVARTVHGHTAILEEHGRKLDAHDRRFDEFARRFDEYDRRFDEFDRRFDGYDQRFDEFDRRFDGYDQRFDGYDRRFDGYDRRFDEYDRRFDEHGDALRALSSSVRDVWQLLGTMSRRNTERFDNLEMQLLKQREDFSALKAHVTVSIGVLKDLIEARDYRLDDHGRRLNALETPRLPDP